MTMRQRLAIGAGLAAAAFLAGCVTVREPFPGEDKLTGKQDLEYSRKAIDRCWKTIRKAAKDANPDCIIWLTSNHLNHPHVTNSDMYRQADWLMGEAGRIQHIEQVRKMVGEHTDCDLTEARLDAVAADSSVAANR